LARFGIFTVIPLTLNITSRNLDLSGSREIAAANQGAIPIGRYALFLLPMLVIAVADLVSKHFVFLHYYPQDPAHWDHEPSWWIQGILGIQTSTNPGALFGIGSGYSWLFAILSLIVFLVILYWLFVVGGARDRWLTLAFGLVSGGIIGNLYDRLGLGYVASRPEAIKNHVRDWIHFCLDGVPYLDPWPNFNIADCGLVVGAVMLVLHAFFAKEEVQDKELT
jgi:signal peptidase II